MALELKLHTDHTTGLVAACDVCRRELTGEGGNLLWRPTGRETPGHTFIHYVACKGACTFTLDQRLGRMSWQPLDVAIGFLLNNARLDLPAVRRRMQALAVI